MKLYKVSLSKKFYWALYSESGEYQELVSEYLIRCVDDLELNESSTKSRAYILKKWTTYLSLSKTNLKDANNERIRSYRDSLLTDHNANASLNAKSRQRTVNQYLKVIYDFHHWLQLKGIDKYILGRSDAYNIYSSLSENNRNQKEYDMYPLLFRRTASKSKHRTTFTPDYNTFLDLYRYFIANDSPNVAERNCLILKIAFEAGLRVGSIASLTVKDFDLGGLRSTDDSFIITPAVQKFGKANSFEVSISLAMDVNEYISGTRQGLVEKDLVRSDHIFLNVVNGTPLLSTSISSIFSKASKKLGLPYRAGIHSFRGLFAENVIDYEIDARQELGFDTSVESIGMVVAKALGHSNQLSQQSYIRSLKSRHRSSQAFRHMQETSSLRDQLLRSIKQTELLRSEVLRLTSAASEKP